MTEETKLDAPGRMTLWKNDSENPSAPTLKGHLYAHRAIAVGEKIDVALWRNDRANEGPQYPVLNGKVSDVFTPAPTHDAVTTTRSAPPPAPPADDFDDDIPF